MYVEGDQRLAYQKLHIAAATNEPDDVRAFAGALKTVRTAPGASRHAAAIDEVAELLSMEATQATKRQETKEAAERAAAKRKPPALAVPKTANDRRADGGDSLRGDAPSNARTAVDAAAKGKTPPVSSVGLILPPSVADLDGRTVVPATDEANRACVLSGIMSPSAESSRGYCVRVARGPLIVTDLHSSSACPAELFALAVVPGDLSTPRWAVYGQPSNAIHVSGGALVVRENEQFVIGVMSGSEQKIKRDVRCAITWSGWRTVGAKIEQE